MFVELRVVWDVFSGEDCAPSPPPRTPHLQHILDSQMLSAKSTDFGLELVSCCRFACKDARAFLRLETAELLRFQRFTFHSIACSCSVQRGIGTHHQARHCCGQ